MILTNSKHYGKKKTQENSDNNDLSPYDISSLMKEKIIVLYMTIYYQMIVRH